jgi:hypothetical protein
MLIIVGAGLIISAFVGFVVANNFVASNYAGTEKVVFSGIVGATNGIIIFVFTEIYKTICFMVNDFQNHKLQSDYDNSYIFKRAFFDFILSYINLAYYAFYLRDFKLLANNFITIVISKNLLFAFKAG